MSTKTDKKALVPGKIVSTKPLNTQDAKWVRLVETTYLDPNNKERTWESSERLTRPENCKVDGVGIIAVLQKSTGPELLMQKQFRPPINAITIEIPAGLIDPKETPEQCAIRELYEETGYIGTLAKSSSSNTDDGGAISCIMFNDPGFCNTNLQFVHLAIDMKDDRNINPQPHLEENEFIECFTVPLEKLWEECRRLEKEGCAIDARVGTLAEGFRIAKMFKFL